MVPGSPEFGPFYLMHALIKAVGKWASTDEESSNAAVVAMNAAARNHAKAKCLMTMVGTCSAWGQKKLPYGCAGVDSNDTLYGGGKDYMEELGELIKGILGEVVVEIEACAEGAMKDELMLGFCETLLGYFDRDDVCLKVVKNTVKKVVQGESGGGKWKAWLAQVRGALEKEVQSRAQ
jgi:hypothetical protein